MDPGLVQAVVLLYGTWDAGKGSIGLGLLTGYIQYDRQTIVDLFANYYAQNGTLPSSSRVRSCRCLPPVPAYPTVQKHFPEHKGWKALMDHMAWKIGVTDGRYGKPEYAKKEMEAA